MLLQHIWFNRQQFCPQLQEYQELIEKVKLTPRIWNPGVEMHVFLKYLSWILNLSINLIGFKRTQTWQSDIFQCTHKRLCFLPYYKFQNPYIRFCQKTQKDFFQMNILEFQSQYYSISSSSCNPFLINQISNFNFCYKSEPVTLHDINSILKQKTIDKPFSIALYSTSSFVKSCHSKIITKHIIGHLQNNSENILHLFLTPHLHGPTFDVYVLELSTNNIAFNHKNIFSNTHITEGKYNFKLHSHPNKEILNQNYCICEHPDTERYHAPSNNSFKPLGKTYFFLLPKKTLI